MNKLELQKNLIAQQQDVITELKEKIDSTMSMVDLDEGDTIDPEDLSHQSESSELKKVFEQKLIKANDDLRNLQRLDFSLKHRAVPGALISTENLSFIIGFATFPFEFAGKRIIGVSIESPIYHEIKDKTIGDSFSFSDNNYTILDIN